MARKECVNCKTCTETPTDTIKTVPFYAYEASAARADEKNKRLLIALVIAIVLMFATNIAWLYYESQFETVSYTQDGDGINNICIGQQEDVHHGSETTYENSQGRKREGREDSQGNDAGE